MFPLPGIPLANFGPEWLSTGPDRYRMGVEFSCPARGHQHRVRLWFANPGDGEAPASPLDRNGSVEQRRPLHAHGDELDHLTVSCADEGAIELRDCGAYWLVDGFLYERLIRGVG